MIRFAKTDDIDSIMNFINTYWRKGHILGVNKVFFEYEHLLPEGVTYVISEDERGNINAILGYIPYGKADRDIMTVMWKANHEVNAIVGLELFQFLRENGDIRTMASPGSNPKLKTLYKYMSWQFDKMTHWYRLKKHDKYEIAVVSNKHIEEISEYAKFISLKKWDELESKFDFDNYTKKVKPYKESWYIKKRYYEHPIYEYDVYGLLDNNNKVELIVVFRVVKLNNANVVRLIDCIGDFTNMGMLSGLLDYVLNKYDAEYVDCYEVGIDEDLMLKSGWEKTEGSGNIIPNYFAPFTQENVDIYYFSSDENIVLFKGDGDQDRPN